MTYSKTDRSTYHAKYLPECGTFILQYAVFEYVTQSSGGRPSCGTAPVPILTYSYIPDQIRSTNVRLPYRQKQTTSFPSPAQPKKPPTSQSTQTSPSPISSFRCLCARYRCLRTDPTRNKLNRHAAASYGQLEILEYLVSRGMLSPFTTQVLYIVSRVLNEG